MVNKREEKKTFKTKKEKKLLSWTSKVNLEYGKSLKLDRLVNMRRAVKINESRPVWSAWEVVKGSRRSWLDLYGQLEELRKVQTGIGRKNPVVGPKWST